MKLFYGLTALVLAAVLTLPGQAAQLPFPSETIPAQTETEPPVQQEETIPASTEEPPEMIPAETSAVQIVSASIAAADTAAPSPEQTASAPEDSDWNLYFGLLHAHTDLSDGKGTVEEAFAAAAEMDSLDFFAVTDHSNSFENADSGRIEWDGSQISADWARGKAAAAAATTPDFVGIFGYEMTWRDMDGLGHMNTFNTPGFVSRNQKDYSTPERYYETLTTVPGSVSQFNHPGEAYGTFENFAHRTDERDAVISLLEVGGEKGFTAYAQYTKALDKGWHVGPTNSQNNHSGNWGAESDVRTVILAKELTGQSLFEAMSARRVYASEDQDLHIYYRLNGAIMGSVTAPAETARIEAVFFDPTDSAIGTVEIVTEGGAVAGRYTVHTANETLQVSLPGKNAWYYLRITQPDGDIAVTAPVWLETAAPEEPEVPETTVPTDPEPEIPPFSLPELPYQLYFGLLHAHTDLSDGLGTVEAAFAAASEVEGLDFFAVTDHSNSLDNAESGRIDQDGAQVSAEWARGKAAAAAVTTQDFVGLFGYEMTWRDERNLGHINTFHTPGFLSRNQDGYEWLEDYYEALALVPGSVSQFNHPSTELGEFQNFTRRTAAADRAVSLLEVGGENGFTAYSYYTKALDQGWHVAPTNSQNNHAGNWGAESDVRTVILAEALTEESLYEAMAARRVYATEDRDLSLYYTLDGAVMGSILPAGESHNLRLLLLDPTDAESARLEVVTDGGAIVASGRIPGGGGEMELTLPGGHGYYYLRITQADGDIAVTAPVWTDSYRQVSVASFAADAALPVQGQQISLTLTVANEEFSDFSITAMKLWADGQPIWKEVEPGAIPAARSRTFTISYTPTSAGIMTLRAEVTGTIAGFSRTLEAELTVSIRAPEMVADILIDGSHGGLEGYGIANLTELASQVHMDTAVLAEALPAGGGLLILPPPKEAYDEAFLQRVGAFVREGGSLVVCGSADPDASGRQNALLSSIGTTLKLRQDTALDTQQNGGTPERIYPMTVHEGDSWCRGITGEQFYCHLSGCTVDPGKGIWLVKGFSTTVSSQTGETEPVLLAREETAFGGMVLVSGSFFLSDEAMPLVRNQWDLPRINQSILEQLLGLERVTLPLSTIDQARNSPDALVRIRGYATSGTSNKYNTFAYTLYLQDDTGGIAVMPFTQTGIQVGTPLEIIGYCRNDRGNMVLDMIHWQVLEEDRYRFSPDTMRHKKAMDHETYGEQLLQVEGTVASVTLTEDEKGVSYITLVDEYGDEARILIEEDIFSGAYGTNLLASRVKVGRTVRAIGLSHLEWDGTSVLRVRNCEEVVYVPPFPSPDGNPFTGDLILLFAGMGAVSLLLLGILLKRIKAAP